jgi:hypothetical protein
MFRMTSAVVGKTIRCRGCREIFGVKATMPKTAEVTRVENLPSQYTAATEPAASTRPSRPPTPPAPIFEDTGDVLDDPLPGAHAASTVQSRFVPRPSVFPSGPLATMVAVVLGGVCAVPATLVILRFVSPEQFERVAELAPKFLTDWLR